MSGAPTMTALVQTDIGGPDVMQIQLRAIPQPAAHQVTIEVKAFGVCRRDAIVRAGILHRGVNLPLVPGHEFAGVIGAVGPEVQGWSVGDRVTTLQTISCGYCDRCRSGLRQYCDRLSTYGHDRDGGYASHVVAEESTLVRIPQEVPFEWAALAGCALGTAYHGLRHVALVEPGDVVVVTGATGGTGIHAVKVAHMLDAVVVALTRNNDAGPALRQAGADLVVTGEASLLRPELDQQLGRRADVVFDTVGSPVFTGALRSLRHGGKYVLFGQTGRGQVSFSPAEAFLKGIDFLSVTGTPLPALQRVVHALERRLLIPTYLHLNGWEDAMKAHELLEGNNFMGRLVVSL